jgi:vacuolar-type H+-ATPase subunit E/Vma4
MALDHLLSALEREAAAQADAVVTAARAEAAAVTRDADERLTRLRNDLLGSREGELRGKAAAALGEARRASRAAVLEARQRLLERIIAAARGALPAALASPAYRATLPQHVAQGLRAVGDGPAVIQCPEPLVPAVQEAVAGRHDVAVRADAASAPGVIVSTTDGVIEADNTLVGRLERLGPLLALELLARLGARP